ncbi:MAG: 50S ribosomal protein L29 [Planctomycetota bacterium]|nr:50S ribosomal protein L29 [Planctomycetota bacterium]
MDVKQLPIDEIRSFEPSRMKEAEGEIRAELLKIRMDIYQAPALNVGKVRTLKKNLARILTIRSEKARPVVAKVEKPKSKKITATAKTKPKKTTKKQ